MTHIVLPQCIRCKYTDCVEVCPVDCFYEGENMLAIDPEICIDCGACVPECPIDAIIYFDAASEESRHKQKWLNINHDAVYKHKWPVITKKKQAEPDADFYAQKSGPDKEDLFSPSPGGGDDI